MLAQVTIGGSTVGHFALETVGLLLCHFSQHTLELLSVWIISFGMLSSSACLVEVFSQSWPVALFRLHIFLGYSIPIFSLTVLLLVIPQAAFPALVSFQSIGVLY